MKERCYYGWVIVAAAAVGLFLGAFPITVFAFGVFFPSYLREFHVGRGAISLAFTIYNFVSGGFAVVAGRIADRAGVRAVILPGLFALAAVLLSSIAIGSSLWQLYLFYAILGVVAPATESVPYGLVVSRWFDRRRGLALGLMMIGLGAGAVIMPPVAQRLIARFGWRIAFAVAGCAGLAIAFPIVSMLLKERPQTRTIAVDEGLPWRDIRRSGTFWLLIAAFVLLAASVHACVIHLPELFADQGASARSAAVASSIVGVALLVGRIGTGLLLDRWFAPSIARAICILAAAGIAMLWSGGTSLVPLTGAFLAGLGMGAEVDIIAFVMSRYFGLRSLGASFGTGFAAFVVAGGVGPLLMGFGFDRTGSYRAPLAGFFAATLLAAALLSRLGPYRFTAERS